MRTRLIALAVICSASGIAHGDAVKAKAANSRGLALHKKKKFKDAAAEYRAAIAEDPNYVLAHYNLACVGSLSKDAPTALAELGWLADRATWDPAAKSAVAKAKKDKDLKWILTDEQSAEVAGPFVDVESIEDFDLWAPVGGFAKSKAAATAKAAATLTAAPGKHDEKCAGTAASVDMSSTLGGKGTVLASLRDGVAVLDPAGQIVARSEPLGCSDAKDQVTVLAIGDAVHQPFDWITTPLTKVYQYVVGYTTAETATVAVYVRKDKQLVRVFDAVVKNDKGTGSVKQTMFGHLVYSPPGEKKKRIFDWDDKAAKFVQTEEK